MKREKRIKCEDKKDKLKLSFNVNIIIDQRTGEGKTDLLRRQYQYQPPDFFAVSSPDVLLSIWSLTAPFLPI